VAEFADPSNGVTSPDQVCYSFASQINMFSICKSAKICNLKVETGTYDVAPFFF
jgi:hypothetical protein